MGGDLETIGRSQSDLTWMQRIAYRDVSDRSWEDMVFLGGLYFVTPITADTGIQQYSSIEIMIVNIDRSAHVQAGCGPGLLMQSWIIFDVSNAPPGDPLCNAIC